MSISLPMQNSDGPERKRFRFLMWLFLAPLIIFGSCVAIDAIHDLTYRNMVPCPHITLPVASVFDLQRFGKAEHFLMVFDYEFPIGTSVGSVTGYFAGPNHANKTLTTLTKSGGTRLEIDQDIAYDENNTGHWHIGIDADAEGHITSRDAALHWIKGRGWLKEARAFRFQHYNSWTYFGEGDAESANKALSRRMANYSLVPDLAIIMIVSGAEGPRIEGPSDQRRYAYFENRKYQWLHFGSAWVCMVRSSGNYIQSIYVAPPSFELL